jgi:hypothetical protein
LQKSQKSENVRSAKIGFFEKNDQKSAKMTKNRKIAFFTEIGKHRF